MLYYLRNLLIMSIGVSDIKSNSKKRKKELIQTVMDPLVDAFLCGSETRS